jgi:hypothetical protein
VDSRTRGLRVSIGGEIECLGGKHLKHEEAAVNVGSGHKLEKEVTSGLSDALSKGLKSIGAITNKVTRSMIIYWLGCVFVIEQRKEHKQEVPVNDDDGKEVIR